jgi:hypothetical protein
LDSDEEELSPEERRATWFEKILKSRIFLSDRIEKVEKSLLTLGAITKDVYYCSKPQLATFKEAFKQDDIREAFLNDLEKDQVDVWFELYKSISSNKEHVEHEVEKQIKKR